MSLKINRVPIVRAERPVARFGIGRTTPDQLRKDTLLIGRLEDRVTLTPRYGMMMNNLSPAALRLVNDYFRTNGRGNWVQPENWPNARDAVIALRCYFTYDDARIQGKSYAAALARSLAPSIAREVEMILRHTPGTEELFREIESGI